MKVTVVPAQITTIEDRIAGRLGLSQLLLLAIPVFGGSVLYALLPPVMHNSLYKLVLLSLLTFICCLLAIRIKGKILLHWLVVILRYNIRPSFFIYDKNHIYARDAYKPPDNREEQTRVSTNHVQHQSQSLSLSIADIAHIHSLIDDRVVHLNFQTNRKGGLNVLITEIES